MTLNLALKRGGEAPQHYPERSARDCLRDLLLYFWLPGPSSHPSSLCGRGKVPWLEQAPGISFLQVRKGWEETRCQER